LKKRSRQGWDNGNLSQLLVEVHLGVVVTMMVMTMVNDNHHLRLRRIRDCEAEEEHEAEQSLFHSSQYVPRDLGILSYCDQWLNEPANSALNPSITRSGVF
jgi:hypothetical protein